MAKKVGRNDPCPCGSGKKYKHCHMLKEKEGVAAKYTPSGKRKFKATHITTEGASASIFSRAASQPQPSAPPDTMEKLRFRMTKRDFREKAKEKELPFKIASSEKPSVEPSPPEKPSVEPSPPEKPSVESSPPEKPSVESSPPEKPTKKSEEPFKMTKGDFRKTKEED